MDTHKPNGQREEGDVPEGAIGVPIEWRVPDTIIPRYATNMIVQNSEHEFVISFFEVTPPVLLGSPEDQIKQAMAIGSIPANCVARIVVAASRMPEFVRALQTNLDQWQERFAEEQSDE